MKAAILVDTKTIQIQDVDTPSPGPGQMLIKVSYTGICGSDVPRVLDGRVHGFPIVLGHEFSGDVAAVGEGVDPALVGRRVAGIPLEPCFQCENCAQGNYSLCGSYGFIGSRSNGSFAEYVLVNKENVFFVDPSVTALQAAFFEPATVAIHGIELAHVQPGKSAIVLGGGTIGTLLAQALSHYGISTVVITRQHEEDFASNIAAGLTNLVATDHEGWQQQALEQGECVQTGGFDYVFDTAGTPETILDAFTMAAPKATVCFVGTPKRDVCFTSSQWELINRKEMTVTGSWMSYSAPWPGKEWEIASALFANGTLRVVDAMIQGIFPLDQIGHAFDLFAIPGAVKGKLVISSRD